MKLKVRLLLTGTLQVVLVLAGILAFVYSFKPMVYFIFLIAKKLVVLDIENKKHKLTIKILRK